MTVSNKLISESPDNILLDGVKVKEVELHKHLGITLSKDLCWTKHIQGIEANKRLNILLSIINLD